LQLADAPAHLRPGYSKGLGSDNAAGPVFRCPAASGPVETLGPGGSVDVRRGPDGLCVQFRDDGLAELPTNGAAALSLGFRSRHWRTDRRTLWIALGTTGGEGLWSLVVGPSQGPMRPVTVGNIGLARDRGSILVADTELPGWVLDRKRTEWTAEVH
jgi:hypothetical protein